MTREITRRKQTGRTVRAKGLSLGASVRRALLRILLLGLAGVLPCAAAETPIVLAGCEPDYPPYCMIQENGQAAGFSVDLLTAVLKAMGREAAFETGPWPDLMRKLAEGHLQVLPLVGRTPEREALFDFTVPYLSMQGAIVIRKDNTDILTPEDLTGKSVAVLKGDNAEEYLRRSSLGAEIVVRPSFSTALQELSKGRHDAVVIQKLLALQLMQVEGLTNLAIAGPPLKDFVQHFCFAVRKGDHELLADLNEGLSTAMTDGTLRRLYAKWFAELETYGQSKRRLIVGGDKDFPPYEYLDKNGQPAGLNVDLTRAIARQLGLEVEIQLGPWGKIREELKDGTLDLVQSMFYSAERNLEFDFSTAHSIIQYVIVVRKGDPEPSGLDELAGKTILVMEDDIMDDLASKAGHGDHLIRTASQEEALRLLHAGIGDCALAAKVPALYWIHKHGWENLTVLADHPVLAPECSYAALKGNQELLTLFSETMAALKETGEFRSLQNRWLSPYQDTPSFRVLLRRAWGILLPLLALLAGLFAWSQTLKRTVRAQTGELALANSRLKESEAQYRLLAENATDTILVLDPHEQRLRYASPAVKELYGYTPEEITRLPLEAFLPPESIAHYQRAMSERIALYERGERGVYRDEMEIVRKDGSRAWTETSSRYVHNERTGRLEIYGSSRDITEKRKSEQRIAALAAVVENSDNISVQKDLDLRVVATNQAFARATGHEKVEDLIGKTDAEIFQVSPDTEPIRTYMEDDRKAQALPRGKKITREERVPCADGQEKVLLTRKYPVFDAHGQLTGTGNISTDITESKRVEQQLRDTIQKLEQMNRLMMGREDRVIELKQEINGLLKNAGKPRRYEVT